MSAITSTPKETVAESATSPRKLLSVLIPSRGRFDQLIRAVRSWHETAIDPTCFDVRIKLDEDDTGSVNRIGELCSFKNVHVLIAPRLEGYNSIDMFCTKMADESSASWICIFNDDAMVEGCGWDTELAKIDTHGFIVHPEISQLGASKYPFTEGAAFPIVPNGCWRKYGNDLIIRPSDTMLDELLRKQNSWKTAWLMGITMNHERYGTVPK